jgi:predicted exporter
VTAGRRAIVVWLIGMATCVVLITRTQFSADMSAFLPRSPSPEQQVLVDQMRDGVVSRLLLIALEGASPDALARLSKEVARNLRQAPDFTVIDNGEDVGHERDRDFLWRNRYLLSPAVTPERFSPEGLRRALEADLQLLASPMAALVKRILPNDPTGEMLALIDRFIGEARPPSRDGVWVSTDGGRAVLLAQTHAAGFDLDGQERALTVIEDAFAGAKQSVGAVPDARLRVSGPGVFAVESWAQMKQDVSRLSLLATVLVAAVLLAAYRSPRVLALALVPVASGALAGIAAVRLGFGFVHGITLGFGVTLIGEAVDYAIYLFTQTAPGSPPEQTLPRIWPTLRLGVLTSICGFSAMLVSSFTGFAQLGLFTIVGLIVAVSVTRWVLPALLPRNFAAVRSTRLAPILRAAVARAGRLRLALLVLVGLAALLLGLHRGGLWEDELSSLSPISADAQAFDRQLRRDIGAPDVRYLVMVTASTQEAALAASERLAGRLTALVGRGLLAGFDAPDRYLPSQATQRARQAALPEPALLRANLKQALTGLPFRADLFEPFLADVAAARTRPPLDRADLRDTSLVLKLDSLLIERAGAWVAMLPLRGVADPPAVADGLGATQETGHVLIDLKRESDRLLEVYRGEALTLALIGALVIVGLLAVSLRSARRVGAVAAPLAAAVIVTAALLTLGGHRLSIFNLFGLLLVVAVGSNYCLFFERQDLADPHAERTVASLVLANLCTVIGFGVLSLSRIPVLHGIGTTVAVGTFFAIIFSAIWTPDRHSGRPRDRRA